MAPTFRQLRYFSVLAEELHFGRSAKRLNISQPPLSASIQQLEKDLGVTLLDRSSRHVMLTPAGRVFADRARRMLNDLEESTGLARKIAASPGGVVRVGFVPSMIFRRLPDMLAVFQRRHAQFTVELREMNSADQLTAIGEGRIELGFVHQLGGDPGVTGSLMLVDEPFVCCLPADHALAHRASIVLSEIALDPLVMFSRERAPVYHDHILGLFSSAEATPAITHEVANWLTIVALVGYGIGVAIVPSALAQVGIGRAAFVPLRDPGARYGVHCIWSLTRPHQARDRLIACVEDMLDGDAEFRA